MDANPTSTSEWGGGAKRQLTSEQQALIPTATKLWQIFAKSEAALSMYNAGNMYLPMIQQQKKNYRHNCYTSTRYEHCAEHTSIHANLYLWWRVRVQGQEPLSTGMHPATRKAGPQLGRLTITALLQADNEDENNKKD